MRTCFVPKCDSGAKNCKEKRHLFKAKRSQIEEWNRLIPRKDKKVTEKDVVCHLHFDDRYLLKTFEHVINGEKVVIDRGKWGLTDDAVPTLFPNCPKYLSRRTPKKRSCPMERKQRAACLLSTIKNCKDTASSGFKWPQGKPPPSALSSCANGPTQNVSVDVESTVAINLQAPEQTQPQTKTASTMATLPFKPSVTSEEIALKRKLSKVTFRYNKQKTKMQLLRNELNAMKKEMIDNKNEIKEVSKAMMENFAERQRNIIKHFVLMSRCTKAQSMRFHASWMLDCLILRTHSSSTYEYLRANNFLPLPCRTTLSNYIREMGSEPVLHELFARLEQEKKDADCKALTQNVQRQLTKDLHHKTATTTTTSSSSSTHDLLDISHNG